MTQLGNGLSAAGYDEDALPVLETELAMKRRLGASEESMLVVQNNLAILYGTLGRNEEALSMRRDVYLGNLKIHGEDHRESLGGAHSLALSLTDLERFEEAKALLRKTLPTVRRVLGESNGLTLKIRCNYARTLYQDASGTLDDLREAVTTLEEVERISRRVFGGAHPLTSAIKANLRNARANLRAREPPPPGNA